MKFKILSAFTFLISISLVFATSPSVVSAFDQPPWDTGHQTTKTDPGDKDTQPGPGQCPLKRRPSPFEVDTGNFIYSTQDILIPAFGPDIDITRTYNSRDMRNGPFGHGWIFTYDQRLIETTDEVQLFVICRQGDGKRERFVRNPDGTYTPPSHLFSTLVKHSDGTWILTEKDGTQRRFNASGQLVALVDRNGNTMTFSYDATGFLISLGDASGRALTFTKGPNGKIDSITDPANRVFRYEYDAEANLVRFTDPLGNITQFVYDAKHNLIRVVDPRGNIAQQITYDALGRVATFTEQGEMWTVSHFPDQKKTTKRDSRGNTWTYFYNVDGLITRTIDSLGNTEDTTYDANFNISGTTDKNGNTTILGYDRGGNLTSVTDALGNVIQVTYEPNFNQLSSITDPLGNTIRYEYDTNGNLAKITDALGSVTQMAYDSKGQPASITDTLGNIYRSTYDTSGNLIKITDPLGNSTIQTYDALGNITSISDAEGRTTLFEYDGNSRLTEVTNALGNITTYNYDANGKLASVIDPKGNTTTFEYDAFSRLTKMTNPLGRSKTFGYDSKGNLISTTDAKGQTISYTYDVLNRLIRKSTPDNTVTLSYDKEGNLLTVADNDSILTFIYDKLNRVIQVRAGPTVAQPATTMTYTYDAESSRRKTMTDPQGGISSYTYDALNRLVSLTNPKGETTTYTYDAFSRKLQATLPNGSVTTLTYDAASRLLNLSNGIPSTTISKFDYVHDRVGNRITIAELAGSNAYTYDALNQLTAATHPQPSNPPERFTYDPIGNRVSSHLSSRYAYDGANRLLEDDTFTYTYDANGNLVQKADKATGQNTRYNYDAENQLIRIDFPDGTTATYRYDGLGRRIEKNIEGAITRYVYDNEDILLEYDSSNQVVAHYTHGENFDEPISMERGGSSFFYHTDGLDSIIQISDVNRSVVQTYTYDSFGQIVDQTGVLENPFTYTSREFDPESSLYYYRARYYDARIGRFLQEDPLGMFLLEPSAEIGIKEGLNLYSYVQNDPLNRVDPTGTITLVIYERYCGLGAKDPTLQTPGFDCVDESCRGHDRCWREKGVKAWYPWWWPSRLKCDRVLCKAANKCPTTCKNFAIKAGINLYFSCAIITPFGL